MTGPRRESASSDAVSRAPPGMRGSVTTTTSNASRPPPRSAAAGGGDDILTEMQAPSSRISINTASTRGFAPRASRGMRGSVRHARSSLRHARMSMVASMRTSMANFKERTHRRDNLRATLRSSLHRPELIGEYHKAIAILLEEIKKTVEGDKILLTVFLLLPGKSSDDVLDGLEDAAKRGAEVELTVDVTIASLFARVGAMASVLPRVWRMAKEIPNLTAIRGRIPDHSKYAIFIRKDNPQQSTAVWGGMNIGDSFQKWKDYAVKVTGPAADLLQIKVAGTAAGVAYPPNKPVNFVVNSNKRGGYEEMRVMFHAMMQDETLSRIQIAMAYIDRYGAELLQFALDRGAEIDLLMPRKANVYGSCNMRTLKKRLFGQPGLRVWLHPNMVHAKALLAYDDDGIPKRSLLGSANLKKNSFGMLKELNSMIDDPKFNQNLAKDLDALFDEANEIDKVPRYFPPLAIIEEFLG